MVEGGGTSSLGKPIGESLQRAEPGLGHRLEGRGRAILGLYQKNVNEEFGSDNHTH